MRWLLVREAKIDPRYRQRFEELGAEIVRAYFTEPIGTIVWTDDQGVTTLREAHEPMQLWLREQFDRAERKETWLLTMEVSHYDIRRGRTCHVHSGFLLPKLKVTRCRG